MLQLAVLSGGAGAGQSTVTWQWGGIAQLPRGQESLAIPTKHAGSRV